MYIILIIIILKIKEICNGLANLFDSSAMK